jgi:hypothetical protein
MHLPVRRMRQHVLSERELNLAERAHLLECKACIQAFRLCLSAGPIAESETINNTSRCA